MNLLNVVVVAATRFAEGVNLVTLDATYPRPIHAELMTARLWSRNAASSRAVPVSAMIERVKRQMYVPWHWRSNKKGMSGGDYLPSEVAEQCRQRWVEGAHRAMEDAAFYADRGLLKGIGNRPLEPYMYIQTLITARVEGLPHFFNLRNDPEAEDHFRDLAALIELEVGKANFVDRDWHLPYISEAEVKEHDFAASARVSSVRCRRVSYFKLDKTPPAWGDDLAQAEEMISTPVKHSSPFEHQAMRLTHPVDFPVRMGNLALPGEERAFFEQFRKTIEGEFMRQRVPRT
jgi:hypothetical protein